MQQKKNKKCRLKGVHIFSDFLFARPTFSNPPTHPDLHVQIDKTIQINGRPLTYIIFTTRMPD